MSEGEPVESIQEQAEQNSQIEDGEQPKPIDKKESNQEQYIHIDNFHLPARSFVLAMSQLSKDQGGLDDYMYIVKNVGPVQIQVEIMHNVEDLGPLVAELDPHETQPIGRSVNIQDSTLKIINNSDEEAIFNAIGGKVLNEDLASTVQKLSDN